MSQWQPFVSVMGTTRPASMDGILDAQLKADWTARAKPLLEQYFALFQSELANRGFTIRITHSQDELWSWSRGGEAERAGLAVPWLIQELTPVSYTPEELAARVETQWTAERDSRLRYGTSLTPYTETRVTDPSALQAWQPPAAGPGPATTVPEPSTSLQPVQSPPAPDPGTLPAQQPETQSDQRYTFDQWNYIYQQQTGRPGPAPEDVGFPMERRGEPITRAEWERYVAPWLTGAGAGGSTGGSGSSAPASGDLLTLVAAILSLLGFRP